MSGLLRGLRKPTQQDHRASGGHVSAWRGLAPGHIAFRAWKGNDASYSACRTIPVSLSWTGEGRLGDTTAASIRAQGWRNKQLDR